tara:strand:- start:837 stop:1619 length:783 start_codon:yes stop_codon:yes gene_type:complete
MTIPYILYKTGPFDTVTHSRIIQCFQTNEKMLKSKIIYFNDKTCKDFIQHYFGSNVVKAYNKLIPGAYKADLWRLCVLYIHGGIYGDVTQTFLKEYDVNKNNADIILVRDRCDDDTYYRIYNAFMAARKGNGFIRYCIEQIVKQVLLNDLGRDPFDITGPQALRRHYLTFFKKRTVDLGLQTIKAIDNKVYNIDIAFYHEECSPNLRNNKINFCTDLDHTKVILNRIKDHHKIVYSHKNTQYYVAWWNEQVFKRYYQRRR